jgi:dihydroflavonol-4-reductase
VNRDLVTGATGLIGGNICRLLAGDGVDVRGLVRDAPAAQPIRELGVELAIGDVLDAESVAAAAKGCDAIIHTAAVLGGTHQDVAQQTAVNTSGSTNIFDIAAAADLRVVLFSTIAVFDQTSTLTERSPVDETGNDPYSAAKRAAYGEAMRRVEAGSDIVFVVPASVYGPSPVLSRAMAATSFNRLIRGALNGRLTAYPDITAIWVRAEDVAEVAISALRAGESGDRYLGVGAEDAIPSRDFYNMACEIAGVPHRVQPHAIDANDPAALATYGESMVRAIGRQRPRPAVDASWTRARLGHTPRPVREALEETVAWLRANGQLKASPTQIG